MLRRPFPSPNALTLDPGAPERGIGIAVVGVVVDAQRSAVLEDDARRTFNLDRDQVGWIPEPADFKLAAVERAGFDGAAIVVRDDLALLVAATDPRTFVWKCLGPRLLAGHNQVMRPAVDRDVEFRIGKARARNNGLKIAGYQSLDLAQARDAHGGKILFEEVAGSRGIRRPQVERLAADVPQRAVNRSAIVGVPAFAQGLAACLVGGECREVIITRPAADLGPFDW